MTPKEQIYAHLYGHPGPLSSVAIEIINKRLEEARKSKGRE